MEKRYIESTVKEMEEFVREAIENQRHVYATTLTYRSKIFDKNSNSSLYVKLPKQRLAINRDMKSFKDGIIKAYKRKGIDLECFFIYLKPDNKKPHFHGLIAISEPKKLSDDVKKYWKRGFIHVTKSYDPNKDEQEKDIFGWIRYIEKYNI